MNKLFKVLIVGGGGLIVDKRVFAPSARSALVAVIENLMEDDPMWQQPGWSDVQVFETSEALILNLVDVCITSSPSRRG